MTRSKIRRLAGSLAVVLTLAGAAVPTAAADDWWADGPGSTAATRPDDRPGPRGAGAAPEQLSVRPDDRAQPRGPGAAGDARPLVVVEQPGGFDWADAGIGAAAAFGLVLLASGLALVALRHRKASLPAL